MFGIGPFEMVLIAVIALVVIGPERFPEFAKIVLRTFRDLRQYVDEAKEDISRELRPVRKEIEDLAKYNPADEIKKSLKDTDLNFDYNGGPYADPYHYDGLSPEMPPDDPAKGDENTGEHQEAQEAQEADDTGGDPDSTRTKIPSTPVDLPAESDAPEPDADRDGDRDAAEDGSDAPSRD